MCFTICNADNGIVVVHQVTSGNIVQPKVDVCAFTCSAFGNEGIAIFPLSHEGGVNEKCFLVTSPESKDEHKGIVESI